MITVDYTDKKSILALATRMHQMMEVQKVRVARDAVLNKLMTLRGPFWLKIVLFILGRNYSQVFFMMFFDKHRDEAMHVWNQMMSHLATGKDAWDPKSAGGYCKAELETLSRIMAKVGFEQVEVVG